MNKAWLSLALTTSLLGRAAADNRNPLPPLLPEAQETQAALEAAPAHLRANAGVYVLERNGYRLARQSANGFNCLVERVFVDDFAPECFDAEGSATLVPVILYRAAERARGVAPADIDSAVAHRYAQGEFLAPRRAGVCYMLSARNIVVLDRNTQKVGHAGPHLMFYAPNLHNSDFGATRDFAAHFIIAEEGTPGAMIIVPVAEDGGHEHH